MTRMLRACIAAFAVSLCFAGSAQALPANFWGVVFQAEPTEIQFQQLKRGGVDSMRVPVDWGAVQSQPGTFNWGGIDQIVKRATVAGIDVLPFLTGAPNWAVPQAKVPGSTLHAPSRLPASGPAASAWSTFLAAAVARYGPNGTLWTDNPQLPAHPIRNWQIWNEPNFKYFVTHPNPAEYGKLVKLSSGVIRAADPGAKIILGGLFARPIEATFHKKPPQAYFAKDFLAQMYAKTPGIKSKFQGVALHPYTGSYKTVGPRIEEVRQVLQANHDGAKGLWITELGWSSSNPVAGQSNTFNKGPAGQVTQLKGAFSLLERNQAKWRIQRLYWFSVDDQQGSCNFCDGSGLFADGFIPKKSWFAYVKFAGGTP
ncbi:MAG: glycosyl hydrolase [Solirubrobacterales bacterium]